MRKDSVVVAVVGLDRIEQVAFVPVAAASFPSGYPFGCIALVAAAAVVGRGTAEGRSGVRCLESTYCYYTLVVLVSGQPEDIVPKEPQIRKATGVQHEFAAPNELVQLVLAPPAPFVCSGLQLVAVVVSQAQVTC